MTELQKILHRDGITVLFEGEAKSARDAVIAAVRSGADLTRADLTGADLTRADLTGADLTRADLTGMRLPYNPVYDRLTEIGVPREQQRVGPLPLSPGWILKQGWPEMYRRLIERYGERW